VELAEVIADSVTSGLELNVTERVVNPPASSRLIVGNLIVGVTGNNRVIGADSGVRDKAVEIRALSAATSSVEDGVVEHTTTLIFNITPLFIDIVEDSGLVASNIAPIPVSTAVVVIGGLLDATNRGQNLTKARVAVAIEDVAEIVDAQAVSILATIARREILGVQRNETEGLVDKSRAIDLDAIGVAEGKDTVLAFSFIGLATVGGVTIAIIPASLAGDVALAMVFKVGVANAVSGVSGVEIDVVLIGPCSAAVVTATSIRLRITDPRAIEAVDDGNRCRRITGNTLVKGTLGLPEITLSGSVTHGELATVLPIAIVVTAKVVIASRRDDSAKRLTLGTTGIALRELNADALELSDDTIRSNVRGSARRINTKTALTPTDREALNVLNDIGNRVLEGRQAET